MFTQFRCKITKKKLYVQILCAFLGKISFGARFLISFSVRLISLCSNDYFFFRSFNKDLSETKTALRKENTTLFGRGVWKERR